MRFMVLCLSVAMLGACAGKMTRAERQDAARINAQLGLSYAQRGQYAAALDKLKRALQQDDELAAAHAGIAFVYQNLAEPQLAEVHYRKALGFNSEDPALKNNFGVFLCSRNRGREAESYFVEAAKDPRYATPAAALTNAGRCMQPIDSAKAERYLRQALQIDPAYRDALGQMAQLSYEQGDYLRTRAFLQRYDLVSGATPALLFIAARTEAALGDAAASETFERRLRLEFPESEQAAQLTSDPS